MAKANVSNEEIRAIVARQKSAKAAKAARAIAKAGHGNKCLCGDCVTRYN